jgi:hypothetical protein
LFVCAYSMEIRQQLVREYMNHMNEIQAATQALDMAIQLLRKHGEFRQADKLAAITSKYAFLV